MKVKPNWNETKQRFEAWWKGELTETPLMSLIIKREEPSEPLEKANEPLDINDQFLNVETKLINFRNFLKTVEFAADSYPSMSLDLGPGSLALYLGSEPIFTKDTVWYKECVHDTWRNFPLVYQKDNVWWTTHLSMMRKAKEASQGEFYINIPDIIENIDILSAMRGPQNTCYDLIDEPEIIAQRINDIDDLYFTYYDAFYNLLKDDQGGSSYTAFQVWGPGKTAKVQCDFSALMSPNQFREFVKPSLERQCKSLHNSVYHLDGKDAIKHVPALMEIEALHALQWTAGAAQPDGGSEIWYPIYDQVRAAGKSLWISVDQGDGYTLTEKVRKLVRRYGLNSLYIIFPTMDKASADVILKASYNGFK